MADIYGYPMRLETPVPAVLRGLFVGIGLFLFGLSTWELWRGVWPIIGFSPFFLFILVGAWTVGIPAILAGLTGWASSWTVENGRIDIRNRNPFTARRHVLTPADVDRFDIVEREAMEGDNTWHVSVVTASGRKFDTYDVLSKQAAEKMRDEMVRAFKG